MVLQSHEILLHITAICVENTTGRLTMQSCDFILMYFNKQLRYFDLYKMATTILLARFYSKCFLERKMLCFDLNSTTWHARDYTHYIP